MEPCRNILWIVTTQWRASACGYAGDANARTPALDALAARSVNYAQAVTPHPFGPFARAALLTGRPSPQNGVRDYYDPLPLDARTIAHDLHDGGYHTAFFGKWHLAPRDRTAPLVGEPHARMIVPSERRGGFDFWEGFEGGFQLNDPWLHGTRLPQPERFAGYQSEVVAARAANHLCARAAPWFGVVSLEAPHPPYAALADGVSAIAPAQIELAGNVPRGGAVEERARRELAGYYAHIAATDAAIGRLIARLPAETVIVFTSAHGDMHGAHGLFRKGWPHEESVRVPLLVRHPDMSPSRSSAAVSLLDLPDMTRGWAEGRAWTKAPEVAEISMPGVVALPEQCDRVWRGARAQDWKYVAGADGAPWLCFDLAEDPLEQRNLVGTAFAARCARLQTEV
ncbi:MAG: sulfatase-like hydrolase/transferase [Opitutaceae bacterium]|nr:sulfatase-like hydrolase/transferase [Opitutaceae bacterium]